MSRAAGIYVAAAIVATAAPVWACPNELATAPEDAAPTRGAGPTLDPTEGIVGDVENDDFAYLADEQTDRYYTHGTHFNMILCSMPPRFGVAVGRGLRLLEPERADVETRWGWGFGQNIYTSERILDTEPRDRPYAGLAYGSAAVITISPHQLNTLELQAGLVGPSAQSWFSQDERHRMIPTDLAKGWKYQLNDEPGFSLQWERRWITRQYDLKVVTVDRTDFMGAEVGTFRTGFSGGMLFRAGWGLDRDFGPQRSWPAPAYASLVQPEGLAELYVFAGVDLRLVIRDITLDGNTFEESARIDKYYFVPEAQAGVALRIGPIRGQYAHVFRFPEFEGQNQEQQFGRFSITFVKPIY